MPLKNYSSFESNMRSSFIAEAMKRPSLTANANENSNQTNKMSRSVVIISRPPRNVALTILRTGSAKKLSENTIHRKLLGVDDARPMRNAQTYLVLWAAANGGAGGCAGVGRRRWRFERRQDDASS
jgi:hypothetical protein